MTISKEQQWRLPPPEPTNCHATTARRCSVIPLLPTEAPLLAKMGALQGLPPQIQVDLVAEGYNQRTVMVKYEGRFYFAFREDLSFKDHDGPKYK
jgi:hypothetical protein